ncbi:hypothetical protein VTK26DRAFT_8032 [Humicola hyalothermophila]
MSSSSALNFRDTIDRPVTPVSVGQDNQPAQDRSRLDFTAPTGSGESSGRPPRAWPLTGFTGPSGLLSEIFRPGSTEPQVERNSKKAGERRSVLIDSLRNTPASANDALSTTLDSVDEDLEKDTKRHSFWRVLKKPKGEDKYDKRASRTVQLPGSPVGRPRNAGHSHIAAPAPAARESSTSCKRHSMPLASQLPGRPGPATVGAEHTPRAQTDKARRRASAITLPSDDRYSMLWHPSHTLALERETQSQHSEGEPPRFRLADVMVGPHSMILAPTPLS